MQEDLLLPETQFEKPQSHRVLKYTALTGQQWNLTGQNFLELHSLQHTENRGRNVVKYLTAWVASEDISSGFIVQEDEEGVWEGTEPPTGPEGRRQTYWDIESRLLRDKWDKSTLQDVEESVCNTSEDRLIVLWLLEGSLRVHEDVFSRWRGLSADGNESVENTVIYGDVWSLFISWTCGLLVSASCRLRSRLRILNNVSDGTATIGYNLITREQTPDAQTETRRWHG